MEKIWGDFYIITEKNTILVILAIRNRLKTYVLKDSTYNDSLQHLIDVVDYHEFIENQYMLLEDKNKFASLDDIY